MKISFRTLQKIAALKPFLNKHPKRKDYEAALERLLAERGPNYKQILIQKIRKFEEYLVEEKQKRLDEEEAYFKKEFEKIRVGLHVCFMVKQTGRCEYGIVRHIFGYNHLTIDVVKTRISKRRVDSKGKPLVVPRFHRFKEQKTFTQLYYIIPF